MKQLLANKRGWLSKYSNRVALSKGVILLLMWTFFVHLFGYFILFRVSIVLISPDNSTYWKLVAFISAAQFISYMLYPVAGLVAEVCLTRFKVMIIGTIMAFIGMVIAVPFIATTSVENCNFDDNFFDCSVHFNLSVVSIALIGTIIHHGGLGLFEANAIQFGADQLQFASNDQLSSFVSWYIWSIFIVKLFIIYIIFSFSIRTPLFFVGPAVFGLLIFLPLMICGYKYKKNFVKEPVSKTNPVTLIYKVLRFVIKHNRPLNRSALTYGEIPSRMDYAKERYGGPFTTEQVENVKTFSRISLLLLTLFGSLLESRTNGLYSSTFDMEYLVLIAWIPIHMLVIRPCRSGNNRFTLMMKMEFGLLLAMVYNLIRFTMCLITMLYVSVFLQYLTSFLYSCSLILVFLSALEFILAQAPRSMQGLLIGLWYAFQSLSVPFFVLAAYMHTNYYEHKNYFEHDKHDHKHNKNDYPQLILYSVITFLSIVSFILFLCVSKWYKYRKREESADVNRYSVIEEYTERQLHTEMVGQLEEHLDDQESLHLISTVHTTYT